jgi:hypothetical protein
MAIKTQRDEILFLILTRVATKLLVVNFKVPHRAAQLATPAIAPQYLLAELPVAFLLKPNRRLFGNNVVQPLRDVRKACR